MAQNLCPSYCPHHIFVSVNRIFISWLIYIGLIIVAMDQEGNSVKRWIVFYPIYINSKKTIAEGRRISVNKACENPTCVEIFDCCQHLQLRSAIEVCLHSYCLYVFLSFESHTFRDYLRACIFCRLIKLILEILCREGEWELCWKKKTGHCRTLLLNQVLRLFIFFHSWI